MSRAAALALVSLVAAGAGAASPAASARMPDRPRSLVELPDKYSLAGNCYGMRSVRTGRFVERSGAGYRASAAAVGGAEPFRMQATRLGSYLLFGRARDFLAGTARGAAAPARAPSDSADWRASGVPHDLQLSLPSRGKVLAVAADGSLTLADAGSGGGAARFAFVQRDGCATYPEAEVNATGTPPRRRPAFGEVTGFVDAHTHLTFFEAVGGKFHCGRPWHPYGVVYALPDCAEIEGPGGAAAPLQNLANFGTPLAVHDTRGWPTFTDWPSPTMLSKESVYWKWLERAWRGGLRVLVALATENKVACDLIPQRRYGCQEMATVRRSIAAVFDLQDYIDAQSGGPGKGWFRVVRDPFEARRVVNQGKLAVVLGIETSRLFDCGVFNGMPQCSRPQVDRQLDEFRRLGVRQFELINKFDNAFAGVAGDDGLTGIASNIGNRIDTNRFFDMRTCTGDVHDKPQPLNAPHQDIGVLLQALPPGSLPAYGPQPHCNARGLTDLGEYLVRRMMERRVLIDPDHLGVRARDRALSLVEAHGCGGVLSSHSWSDDPSYRRIQRLGGVLAHHYNDSTAFVKEWRRFRRGWTDRHYYGTAIGSDVHGISAQGRARGPSANPVRYPFKSFDGAVTFDRSRAGRRVFDVNSDGVAHYGLLPDWIEDLRRLAGDRIVDDLARGAESCLQMWERGEGIPPRRCRPARGSFTRRGLGRVRLGQAPRRLLRAAGQPIRRARAWRYCVGGRGNAGAEVVAVFTRRDRVGLVAGNARGQRAAGVGRGASARRLRGRTVRLGRGLRTRRARGGARLVYVVRGGRVRWAGVASRAVARNRSTLRRYVALAGLRP